MKVTLHEYKLRRLGLSNSFLLNLSVFVIIQSTLYLISFTLVFFPFPKFRNISKTLFKLNF